MSETQIQQIIINFFFHQVKQKGNIFVGVLTGQAFEIRNLDKVTSYLPNLFTMSPSVVTDPTPLFPFKLYKKNIDNNNNNKTKKSWNVCFKFMKV